MKSIAIFATVLLIALASAIGYGFWSNRLMMLPSDWAATCSNEQCTPYTNTELKQLLLFGLMRFCGGGGSSRGS